MGREWKEKGKGREEGREIGNEREENRKGRGREKGRMPLSCVLRGWMCAASAAKDWSMVDNGRPETGGDDSLKCCLVCRCL